MFKKTLNMEIEIYSIFKKEVLESIFFKYPRGFTGIKKIFLL